MVCEVMKMKVGLLVVVSVLILSACVVMQSPQVDSKESVQSFIGEDISITIGIGILSRYVGFDQRKVELFGKTIDRGFQFRFEKRCFGIPQSEESFGWGDVHRTLLQMSDGRGGRSRGLRTIQ